MFKDREQHRPVRLSTKAMRMCTGGHSVVVNETVDLVYGVPVKATVKLVA